MDRNDFNSAPAVHFDYEASRMELVRPGQNVLAVSEMVVDERLVGPYVLRRAEPEIFWRFSVGDGWWLDYDSEDEAWEEAEDYIREDD